MKKNSWYNIYCRRKSLPMKEKLLNLVQGMDGIIYLIIILLKYFKKKMEALFENKCKKLDIVGILR